VVVDPGERAALAHLALEDDVALDDVAGLGLLGRGRGLAGRGELDGLALDAAHAVAAARDLDPLAGGGAGAERVGLGLERRGGGRDLARAVVVAAVAVHLDDAAGLELALLLVLVLVLAFALGVLDVAAEVGDVHLLLGARLVGGVEAGGLDDAVTLRRLRGQL